MFTTIYTDHSDFIKYLDNAVHFLNKCSYNVQVMNTGEKEDSLTLGILNAIERNEDVTQRNLASDLGVALGLANSYLKRCARKGYIKIQQAPANRYLYYLTPKGFSEKSRLSAKYLSTSFDFYRKASKSFTTIYQQSQSRGWDSILFCGLSELTEIAFIRVQEFDLRLVGILDDSTAIDKHLGLPVWHRYEDVPEHDACVLTTLEQAEETYKFLVSNRDSDSVFVPDILGLRTEKNSQQP